jgi:hypothetical protein
MRVSEATIRDLEVQIRECINHTRVRHQLLKDSIAWNQLCSSLDAIGDTELAFDAYAAMPNPSDGSTYILVYGLLQALIIQQDAVRHLAESLDIPFVPNALLSDIREVRNSSVGHPTKRHGEPRSHFISRISMSKAGFQLLAVYPDHAAADFRFVDIPDLIKTQRMQLKSVMAQVVVTLHARDEEHKAMFRDKRLTDAFPASTDYHFGKLYESVHSSMPRELGGTSLGLVSDAVLRFKSMLAERGTAGAYEGIEYHLRLVEYPLDELRRYFAVPQESKLNERDANIFIHFVEDQVNTLREIAAEIDETYQ